jgi:hypothetical protein
MATSFGRRTQKNVLFDKTRPDLISERRLPDQRCLFTGGHEETDNENEANM